MHMSVLTQYQTHALSGHKLSAASSNFPAKCQLNSFNLCHYGYRLFYSELSKVCRIRYSSKLE